MKKLTMIVTIALLTKGCASVESTFSQYNDQALKIKPSKEADYKDKHAELAQSIGEIQQSLESPYGTIYAFSQGGYDSFPYAGKPFLRTAEELFKNSCKGEVSSLKRFEVDTHEGRLNPLHYATEEEIELMSKHAVGWFTSSVTNKTFPQYLKVSHGAILNRDQEEYRDSIANYYTPFVESVDFVAKGIILSNHLRTGLRLGTKACYSDGKMVGAQIFFSHSKGKNVHGYSTAIAGTHALTSLYIPSKTIDTFIKNAFEVRLENVARQIRLEEAAAARKAAQKEEREATERAIAKRDAAEKQKWNNRFDNELNIGDSVCTPDNKIGFIEQVNGNNIKVWFRGKLAQENQNYFFGNSPKRLNSSFSYEKLNDLTWVKRGDVASCEFKLGT